MDVIYCEIDLKKGSKRILNLLFFLRNYEIKNNNHTHQSKQ